MGMKSASRRTSTREKGKSRGKIPSFGRASPRLAGVGVSNITELTHCAAVPDPYPIDDDLDLLDDESPEPPSRPEPSRRKSKRDSVQPAEPLTAPPSADDPVVIERMEVDPAPAEAERPRHRERERERERERPRRERGNSDAMATLAGVAGTAAAVSGFKNMFGLGRKKNAPAQEEDRRDRRRTAYETEDERKRRKRSTTRGGMTEDEAKRLRHERRSVRKPTRAPDGEPEPMMTGANGSGDYDPEREARRAARRARHEQEKEARRAELEEAEAKAERRRERARDTEGATLADKKARQMAELERRNKEAEEQLRRMAEKDERRKSKPERRPTEDGTREHRSSRRKEKEPRETSRPHNERRRSHVDDDTERRRRHEERRAARRNSDYPAQPSAEPIADYFDERNGTVHRPATTKRSSRRTADEEQNMPYINKGPDKTSSWVQSLSEEPPLPPPISETVLDPMPGARNSPDDEETPSQDEDIRLRIAGRKGGKREKERDRVRDEKDKKHSRRKSHYEGTRGSVEEGEKKKERRKTYANPAYEDVPVRTWDGRPAADGNAGQGKRGSWFKKIF
jgi:hypothetical protein